MSQRITGSCHCRNIEVVFETEKALDDLPLRVCQCTFCTRHRPRYTSDPQGKVLFRVAEPAELGRYRFALKLADFLFCRRCGVFVGAYEPDQPGRAVINLNVFPELVITREAISMSYDGEDEATRKQRRAKSWTPAELQVGAHGATKASG